MREIKFRAWDFIENTLMDASELSYGIQYNKNKVEIISQKDCFVFLQYTGLKDKNDIEIYEGHILQIELDWGYGPAKILSKVYFENGCFRAKALNSHEDTLLIELPPCEVIGSIYENPELLKVTQ